MADVTPEATPGQAAYEAYADKLFEIHGADPGDEAPGWPSWRSVPDAGRAAWDAAAEAAIDVIDSASDVRLGLAPVIDRASLRDRLARAEAERDAAREEIAHLSAALAGDNEGVRLWMLDCGALVDKHRQERDAAREDRNRLASELEIRDEWRATATRYDQALERIRDFPPRDGLDLHVEAARMRDIAREALEGQPAGGTGARGDSKPYGPGISVPWEIRETRVTIWDMP